MEAKFKKFQEFNWKDSEEWQSYYRNLFPTPPGNKIDRYKRKFYKLKIDSDFDINYNPPESGSSTNSYTSNQNQQFPNFQPSQPANSINSPLLTQIETLLFIFFALSLPLNFHTLKFASIGLLIRAIRLCGIPQFNANYAQILFTNDTVHMLLYTVILFIDRFNYFTTLPTCIGIVVYTAENLKTLNMVTNALFTKYINLITSKQNELLQCRAHVEIANGFLLVIGFFLKTNSLILPILYWQTMKVKYVMNPYIQNSFRLLNQKVNAFKNQPNTPALMKTAIEKIQWLFEYMGKVDIPQEGQQQQQQSAGSKCTIF
jgi:hypothetical protein